MKLKSARFFRKDKKAKARQLHTIKLRQSLLNELEEKLKLHLETKEVVSYEVEPRVLAEFLDILDENFLMFYSVTQVDNYQFEFREKLL